MIFQAKRWPFLWHDVVTILTRIASFGRAAWLATGVAVVILMLMEVVFATFFSAEGGSMRAGPEKGDSRAMADTYQGAMWTRDLYDEFWISSAAEWSPYVYFRRKPFDGRYINIDRDGIRQTANNAATASAPKRIFVFGGSTMWGTGVRDEFTIPSLLAAELGRSGIEARITNFGESGYVTTQEVITLLLQLRDGNVPDAVIFYDGVNDLYAAYQSGLAGIPQNEANRAAEFNLSQPDEWRRAARFAITGLARSSATAGVARDMLATLGISQVTAVAEPLADRSGSEATQLAESVLQSYKGNLGIVNGLAATLGFKAWFFWQPTIFDKRQLSAFEQGELSKQAELRDLFTAASILIRTSQEQGAGPRFSDLSQIFVDEKAPVFIDWCHIGERGNQLVAAAMAEQVLRDGL